MIAATKSCTNILEQVYDEDVGQDEKLGVTKVRLSELEAEATKELELRLMPALDMLKVKDKKDRGTIALQVSIISKSILLNTLVGGLLTPEW